jgi:hypothetical protein
MSTVSCDSYDISKNYLVCNQERLCLGVYGVTDYTELIRDTADHQTAACAHTVECRVVQWCQKWLPTSPKTM